MLREVDGGGVGLGAADVDADDDGATELTHARASPHRTSGVRQLVGLDPGDHLGVLAVVEHDVLLDLVVVTEPEVAVGALPVLVHYDKLSRV